MKGYNTFNLKSVCSLQGLQKSAMLCLELKLFN
ncbi:hypothetical protein J2Z25_000831 [Clostridium tertium]|nr:hypothetical protein [Clostridium tertium]